MKNSLRITIFFFPLLISSSIFQSTRASDSEPSSKDFIGGEINRRILHQPLFPDTSTPSSPPPPPPPPDTAEEDQPFFHELPTGPSLDQGQQTLPPPSAGGAAAANPVITPPENSSISHGQSIKKIAIAISSGVLTLGMLSVMAFFLYKHRAKHLGESQKLVGRNSERNNEASNMPPSTLLYIGTVEPSTATMVNESNGNGATRSPYRKIRTQRYRPSPELQPLPPLTKPPPPPRVNSPPPLSSSDDESNDTNFYTPNGTSRSNESSSSRQSYSRNNMSVPHSKRTSPKSRLSSSSPDAKPIMIPSIKQSPPDSSLGPLQRSKTLSYIFKRPKFAAPPPPPDMARLRLITGGENKETSQITCLSPHAIRPPPPPPPPPPLSMSRNREEMKKCIPSLVSKPVILQQSKSPKISSEKADPEEKDGSKRRLKPLHWDKVRATSEQATVWDQLKSSSFQLNEDAMESLFGCNSANSVPKEVTRKTVVSCSEQENRVLDPKKSQNIAILLRALNVTRDEVSEALLDGNPEGLGADLLETLVKMAPTKEEEIKLKDYNGESSKLGSAERFLKEILDIPFAFKRVDAMLYRANFDTEVKYLRTSFQALEKASEELKSSRLFLKLLEAVLRAGNRMNDGTNRGEARAFKLDTLLKLVDIKGTDGKTTLLHFVVQEIIRSEGENPDPNKTNSKLFKEEEFKKHGLQVLSGLSKELGNVKKAAGMDSDVLSSYVSKLETGLQKVRLVLQYEIQGVKGKFFGSMKEFLTEAVEEISKVKAEERKALSLVKEVTQYFHADAAKDEARQFRIFVIVRDFLSILETVCKDVGRMQDRATMGAGRSFRIPATASLPVLTRYNMPHDGRYDDDDST